MRAVPASSLALLLVACATTPAPSSSEKPVEADKETKPPPLGPFAESSPPGDAAPLPPGPPVLLRGGRVMTAAGVVFDPGHVLLENGRIARVGQGPGEAPRGVKVIDVTGKVITPGLIDTHSHIGVYPWPEARAHSDGNEATAPVTSEVWAEHSFWPQDPAIWRALSGGITTIQVLPGSANLIGGRSFTAKLRPRVSAREMRFAGAPQGLKMACGENPKRVYGGKGRVPSTRMGNVAVRRATFLKAWEHRRKLQKYERDLAHWQARRKEAGNDDEKLRKIGDAPEPPARSLELETLVKVLDGEILVHAHCYRADDMARMLDVAEEFGFHIRSFHHALEAYKLRDRLAQAKTATSTWADWWGFKLEAYDGIPANAAMLEEAGALPIIHSDSADEIRRLHQEAAKALTAGRELGIAVSEDAALRWVTKNPAWALGIDEKVGTLEVGKQADVVVWSGSPFSVYAVVERVFIDGAVVFDKDSAEHPTSDFEVGQRHDGPARVEAAQSAPSPFEARAPWPAPAALGPSSSFAVVGARIEVGDGTVIDEGTVVVKDGRIAQVAKGSLRLGGMPVVDGKGQTLTPGLFETRTQLGAAEVLLEDSTVEADLQAGALKPAFRVAEGFNPASPRIPIERKGGVTHAIVSPYGGVLAGQGALFTLAGWPSGPSPDEPVAMFGWASAGSKGMVGNARGGVWLALRRAVLDTLDYRKSKAAFDRGDLRPLSLGKLDLEAMLPVVEGRLPLVLAIDRAADLVSALRFVREMEKAGARLRLVVAGGAEAWKVAADLAAARVPVILTPSMQTPHSFDELHARDDNAALLAKAGVRVVLSSFNWDNNVRRLRQEAGLAVANGLPRDVALAAVTSVPAEVFGLSDLGRVAVGQRASLVLWEGDPLELAVLPTHLWIDGAAMSLESRQTELGRKYGAGTWKAK